MANAGITVTRSMHFIVPRVVEIRHRLRITGHDVSVPERFCLRSDLVCER